jgi:hypothetical protein
MLITQCPERQHREIVPAANITPLLEVMQPDMATEVMIQHIDRTTMTLSLQQLQIDQTKAELSCLTNRCI